jgi:putative RecB family exonuclease
MSQTTTPLLADKVAWDGNDLVVTDPQVLKSLRRPALSASTAKSFQSCTARWVGERLLRDEEENPFDPAPLGTAAHAVLETLYGLPAHERTRERAYEILKDMARVQWARPENEALEDRAQRIADRTRWLDAVKHKYLGLWKVEDPQSVVVHGLETKIENIEIHGVPVVGFIDRQTKQQKPRGIKVEDYKSGKYKDPHPRFGDDHGDQLRIYAEAIRVQTGVMPVAASVIYTDDQIGRARPVSLSKTNMKKTLDAFAGSWNKHNECMDSGTFPTKTMVLCSWCPLLNACPAGQAEGYEDRTGGQLLPAVSLGIPTLRQGAAETTADDFGDDDGPAEVTAETVTETVVAAHMNDSSNDPSTDKTEDDMSVIKEAPPYELTAGGELNPNAYAATAIFGLASLAVEELHKAGQGITKSNVTSLAQTFHYVVSKAQFSWTGSTSLQDGANTRMRGALRTCVETIPLPWGEDADAWALWTETAVKRCRAITSVALSLYEDGVVDEPWEGLNTVPVPAKAEAPARARRAPKAATALRAVPNVETEAPAVKEEETPVAETPKAPAVKEAPVVASDDEDYIPDDTELYDDDIAS